MFSTLDGCHIMVLFMFSSHFNGLNNKWELRAAFKLYLAETRFWL